MRYLPRKGHGLFFGFRDGPASRRTSGASRARAKKQRRAFLIAPLLGGILLGGVVDSVAGGGKGMAALTKLVQDPLSLFEQRSPGERGAGALLSTKGARKSPKENVRETARNAAPPAEPQSPFAGLAEPELPALAFLGVPEGAPLTTPFFSEGLPGPSAFFGGPPLTGLPGAVGGPGLPGGGGGTTPPGTTPGTPTPEGPPSPPLAIPEPATWLTMLLGFFVTGLIVRWRAVRVAGHSID
jgi:hypothetical protein